MDLTPVAVYTICDNFLILLGPQEHPPAQMSDVEVITTGVFAVRDFKGNQQTTCAALKTLGYLPRRTSDVNGLQGFRFDLLTGSVVYVDKVYSDYGIGNALQAAEIPRKPLPKKNSKRQYPSC